MVLATLLLAFSSSSSSRFARAACIAAGVVMLAGMFASSAWSPRRLFSAGEPGFFYDPSDAGTLFQDAARTVPIAGVGDPVGGVLDLSGNANHASQTTAAARPIYNVDGAGERYLHLDGVDDWLASPFTPPVAACTLLFAFRRVGVLNDRYLFQAFTNTRTYVYTNGRTTKGDPAVTLTSGGVAPDTTVVLELNWLGPDGRTYLNGVLQGAATFAGTAELASQSSIGAHSGSFGWSESRIFAAIGVGRVITPSERLAFQRWASSRAVLS